MNKTMIDNFLNTDKPLVMIVDDEECIRETVFELLLSEGIGVLTASGCEQCLEHLKAGFRGIILMDVMMPGKNGWQTVRAIKEHQLLPGNIVIMLTALEQPDEQMDGLQEIIIDYITKPFEPESLIDSIRNYLNCLQQLPQEVSN